jgi:hypothetical protein
MYDETGDDYAHEYEQMEEESIQQEESLGEISPAEAEMLEHGLTLDSEEMAHNITEIDQEEASMSPSEAEELNEELIGSEESSAAETEEATTESVNEFDNDLTSDD